MPIGPWEADGTEYDLTSVTALNCTVVFVGDVCVELLFLPLNAVTGLSTSIADIESVMILNL